MHIRIATLVAGFALLASAQTIDEALAPVDHPAIQYYKGELNDPVSRLIRDMQSGKVKLDKLEASPGGTGFLPALLHGLGVNPDSQVMVFSKTSFQAVRISPHNPRAIYFSDDVTVGYVRGSNLLEVADLDPKLGIIFYSFDQEADPPRFDRRDVCLQCHESKGTLGVPGLLVASVYPDADGMPAFMGAQQLTDHRSRFEDRWGGWYVTGTHGDMRHLGNAVGHERDHPEILDTRGTLNLTSLAKKFDPSGYLSATSDIVALMTLEHQTRMTDLMIRVGWEARVAEHDGKFDPAGRTRYENDLNALVTYMLFADESPLQADVAGVSTFTKTFPERGPRDAKGRSLRDFDLHQRLFRYPLSYMIYSDAFDSLPDSVRGGIYQKVYDVLTGKDTDPKFNRLPASDRAAVFEIVRDTKSGSSGLLEQTEVSYAKLAGDTIPGTYIFDGEAAMKGYALNKMCYSFNEAKNREAFLKDEDAYCTKFGLNDEQRKAIKERNVLGCIHAGGNIYYLAKFTGIFHLNVQDVGAQQTGMTVDEFKAFIKSQA